MILTSFAFLTERHVLLAENRSGCQLIVFDFLGANSRYIPIPDLSPSCVLCYPTISSGARLDDVRLRSDPAPLWTPYANSQVPFHTSRDNRLFVVTLHAFINEQPCSWTHFIPLSTILEQMRSGAHSVPWKSWIPRGTRMFPAMYHSPVWVCYVFGQKYITPCTLVGLDESEVPGLQVLDFNQRAIKLALGHEIVTKPDVIESSGDLSLFHDTVSTSLPYRATTLPLPRDADDCEVMCSEDNVLIVGVRTHALACTLSTNLLLLHGLVTGRQVSDSITLIILSMYRSFDHFAINAWFTPVRRCPRVLMSGSAHRMYHVTPRDG
jgi:hypothetical protein